MVVYVLNKHGKPLMPTERCGHVRYLLKHQLASVASCNPFTIRLHYETDDKTQPLVLGIDPGRTSRSAQAYKGGSETLPNRVGLCNDHHKLVHTDAAWTARMSSVKASTIWMESWLPGTAESGWSRQQTA